MNSFLSGYLQKAQRVSQDIPMLTFLGEEILRTKTLFSSLENSLVVCGELESILGNIRSTTGVGRGLAAPQIGSGERCFITFVDDEFQYFINPEIVSSSQDTNWYRENCLSCGPISCDLERSREITLRYINKEGVENEDVFEGFWARLLQHEYDHLEGIVNITKANSEDVSLVMSDPLKEGLRNNR